MVEEGRAHKYRAQNGVTPGYRAFHEVSITKVSKLGVIYTSSLCNIHGLWSW